MTGEQRRPRRVSASRTGAITQNADGPAIAVSGVVLGDITVGDSVYTIEDVPVAPAPFSADPLETPSRLLAVHQQTVAFTGRTDEIAALEAWRDAPGTGWSIRLIHGPGGQGKTRLALQFTALSIAAGWRVVQARHSSMLAPAGAGTHPTGAGDRGLLLVVDYAERWPTEHLLGVLTAPALRRRDRVRVLLVSRQAGDWWQAIRHELRKLTPQVDQSRLEALARHEEDRVAAFVAARDEFARILDVDASDVPPPAELSGTGYDLVLSIHMAALVAVHTRRTGGTASSDLASLSGYLLEREQAAWRTLARRGVVSTSPAVMAKTVATAILTRALPAGDAVAVLEQVGVVDAGGAPSLLDDHATCYPSTRPGVYLAPLYPDRLAEDFLALTLPGHRDDCFVPASVVLWAETLVETLLVPATDDEVTKPWLRDSLTVLIETARRWPHVAEKHLFPLLRKFPRLAVVAGGAALIRLAEMPNASLEVLAAIESELPHRRHVDLDPAMAAISERVAQLAMARTQDRAIWARLLTTLGRRLAYAGHRERALAAFSRAVRICAKLDEADPDGIHGADAAYAHDMWGLMLLTLGRGAEAVDPARTAVARYRALARRDRVHLPRLAGALSNLGLVLTHTGRLHDAITAHEEALRIRRRLHRRNPQAYADELAISLSNLGGDLARLGRHNEALAMSLESLELRRRLAATAPATFAADVAISLNNLVASYVSLDRRSDALDAAREAVRIRRDLAEVNAAAFEPDLASALTNLGVLQTRLANIDDAAAALTQAVEIYRRLSRTDRFGYAKQQALAAVQLALLLLKAGRNAEARDAATEALSLDSRMTQVAPEARRHHMVLASAYLVQSLHALGEHAEAENAAAGILDRGASWTISQDPPGPAVAAAFRLLAQTLTLAERHDEALAAAELSVRTYRSSTINPDDHATVLGFADSLLELGRRLRRTSRPADGLRVVREATVLLTARAPGPTADTRRHAVTAAALESLLLYETGEFAQAVEVGAEAFELSRSVPLPAGTATLLAGVVDLAAAWLSATDREVEAARARERADEVRSRETVGDEEEVRFQTW